MTDGARDIAVRGGEIRLGQLLKHAGLAQTGGHAKILLADGAVTVNGDPESRRGRLLHSGDTVTVAGEQVRLVTA